jgi:hypothetical protein
MISELHDGLLFALCAGCFFAVIEVGFRIGRRSHDPRDGAMVEHVNTLQTAVLGLLALLLSFTFAMAIERYDTRKVLVLEEANSIGTTYLRAQFLDESSASRARQHLRDYVDARLEFYYARNDAAKLSAAIDRSRSIEEALWATAAEATQSTKSPVYVSLFIQSLNDIIDNDERRRAALENHVPEPVVWLLFLVGAFGLGLIGYGCGVNRKRRPVSTALFAVLIAGVLVVILDIDQPRSGLIQVIQASLERLKEATRTP